MQRDIVSREDLERELREIEAHAPGRIEGVFGPASLTWRVHREAAMFLGAGRALLLQLAHPWVAASIAEHPPRRTTRTPVASSFCRFCWKFFICWVQPPVKAKM